MKDNAQIRREAGHVTRSHWFWRIVFVTIVLQSLGSMVDQILRRVHTSYGIMSLTDHLISKAEYLRQGLVCSLPTRQALYQMIGASALQVFLAYVFGAIALFGMTEVLLKAIRKDETHWLGDSFAGFRYPLGLTALLFLINLRIFLWSCLFLVPGFVALYRYRAAWYLKTEHPEWSAVRCLAESGKTMKGHKWMAFELDISYLLRLLVPGLLSGLAIAVSTFGLVGSVLASVTFFIAFCTMMYQLVAWFVARTIFYREVKAGPCPAAS